LAAGGAPGAGDRAGEEDRPNARASLWRRRKGLVLHQQEGDQQGRHAVRQGRTRRAGTEENEGEGGTATTATRRRGG
ncbi:unnamed protein product, partial [Ectocarpus sp. 8 AP-2014]